MRRFLLVLALSAFLVGCGTDTIYQLLPGSVKDEIGDALDDIGPPWGHGRDTTETDTTRHGHGRPDSSDTTRGGR